jgi:hypothetical protein
MDLFAKPVLLDKASIGGTVGDAAGKSLPGAAVMIVGGSPVHRDIAAMTDDQGRYRFDSLIPGNYTLLVNAAGHPPQEGRVAAGAGVLARLDFVMDDG